MSISVGKNSNIPPTRFSAQALPSRQNLAIKKPSFKGLKENIKIGKKLLDEYEKEFPDRKSSTIMMWENDCGTKKHSKEAIDRLQARIEECRENACPDYYSDYDEYINDTKAWIKRLNACNCAEDAEITQYNGIKQGIKVHTIGFEIKAKPLHSLSKEPNKIATRPPERRFNDHTFPILGLRQGCKLTDPKTWGDEAVIADPWSKKIGEAKKVLESLLEMMNFQNLTEKLSMFNDDSHLAEQHLEKLKEARKAFSKRL